MAESLIQKKWKMLNPPVELLMYRHHLTANLFSVEDARYWLLQPSTFMWSIEINNTFNFLSTLLGAVPIDMAAAPCLAKLVVKLGAARCLRHAKLLHNRQFASRNEVRACDHSVVVRFL